jgi:dipeptidyl-peptidase-4
MRRYEENPKGYDQNAPMFIADQLKGAFLLIHGLADDNVHFQHSAELMNALMHNNKQFESYVYPNEDHSISGGYLRVHVFNKITSFLNQNLKS